MNNHKESKNLEETRIVRKDLGIVTILFNTLSWFYMMHIMMNIALKDINATYEQNFAIWSVFSICIIGSSIAGSFLSNWLQRDKLIRLWLIFGTFVSLIPAFLGITTFTHILMISIFFGTSLGVGMPSCLAYFSDNILVENRGRRSGTILAITNLAAPFFAITLNMFDLQTISIIFSLWRASSLMIFSLRYEAKPEALIKERNSSLASVILNRSFFLYFIAWLMFCLIDSLEWPILSPFLSEFQSILLLGPIIASLSALIAGSLSDSVGRKRMVIFGFIAYGIAYAVIGVFPYASFSWYSHFFIDSVATGILWVSFIFILWGDLSEKSTREAYYVIGISPYFMSDIIQPLSATLNKIPVSSAFSLASFFLFIAVLPLLYAPETLPKRKMELRQLRNYLEKAEKVKSKSLGKGV